MTTPYIIGGESAVRESEIPNAHSMVRKAVGRKTRIVTGTRQERKEKARLAQAKLMYSSEMEEQISQRKQTLLIAGDEKFMPRAYIDLETKELHSLLPLEVKELQSNTSLLAYFIRCTLRSAGLRKATAKKLTKPYFPSHTKIKRLAKKRGVSRNQVRNAYLLRQATLHQYCSQVVHSEWKSTYAELKNIQVNELNKLKNKLDEIGGFVDPHKVTIEAAQKEIQQINKFFETKINKNQKLYQTISDWAEKGKTITAECVKHSFVNESLIGRSRADLKLAAYKALNNNKKKHEEDKQDRVAHHNAIIKSLNEDTIRQNAVAQQLVDEKLRCEERIEHCNKFLYRFSNIVDITVNNAPWRSSRLSNNLVQEKYVLTMLELAEKDEMEFAPLHHPDFIWPQALTAERLNHIMGEQFDLEQSISIPRTNKPKFKGVDGLKQRAGIANIRQLSETLGLPTEINNGSEFKRLNAKELLDQYNKSSIELMIPKGVMETLGSEFNDFWNEGATYRNKWAGDLYSFTTPSHEVQEEKEVKDKLAAMMAKFANLNL